MAAAASGRPISLFKITGANIPLTIDQRQGGSGWFGTVGIGYDWQFNGPWVAGVFADGQFGSIKGTLQDPIDQVTATDKDAGRVGGWCAGRLPGSPECSVLREWWLLRFSLVGHDVARSLAGAPVGAHTDSFNRNGWFIGGGVENNLNIFGITAPGWFMKTEYRSAFYDKKSIDLLADVTNVPVGVSQVQQLEPDHLDFAGLPLQLGWPGRREVLIFF